MAAVQRRHASRLRSHAVEFALADCVRFKGWRSAMCEGYSVFGIVPSVVPEKASSDITAGVALGAWCAVVRYAWGVG